MIELKAHNQKAVDEIKEKLLLGFKKILYVAGTGCGKTWVFMGTVEVLKTIIKEYKGIYRPKVLYIMPKHVIKENVEGYDEYRHLECRVDFSTYNYFDDYEKGINLISNYDVVVIDECHHLGADLYGQTIVKCMNNSNKCFLGLTATPYRDTDKVDVTDYFETRVNGIGVFDAIRLGLMPMFNYHICLPEKDIKQLEQEYEGEIRAVVDYMDSAEAVYDVVTKYNRSKWICFFNSEKDINDAMETVKEIFEGYEVYVLLSSLRNLNEVMEKSRKAEKAVILSVNILLEGVHIDVDGIVLFRNVCSTGTFSQILGRCCRIGNTIEPVVIDTSQSARKILLKLLAENKENVGGSHVTSTEEGHKEIMRVGIGDVIEYDITNILRMFDPNFVKEEKLKEATLKAIEKYKSFHGKEDYSTYDELKRSGLDYDKFKACAELYRISAEIAWKYWKAS